MTPRRYQVDSDVEPDELVNTVTYAPHYQSDMEVDQKKPAVADAAPKPKKATQKKTNTRSTGTVLSTYDINATPCETLGGNIYEDGTLRYSFNSDILMEDCSLVPNFKFPTSCPNSRTVCQTIDEYELSIQNGSVLRHPNNKRYESISANTLNSYIGTPGCPEYLYVLNLTSPGDKADKRLVCLMCSALSVKRSTTKRMNIITRNGNLTDLPVCVLCQVRLGEDFYNRVFRFDHNAIINRIVQKKLMNTKFTKPLAFDIDSGVFLTDADYN